jgi:hypothetical protein
MIYKSTPMNNLFQHGILSIPLKKSKAPAKAGALLHLMKNIPTTNVQLSLNFRAAFC